MKAALFLSILSASLLTSTASVTAQDTPLWRYTPTEKIEFYRISPLGDLVVGMNADSDFLQKPPMMARWHSPCIN